MRTAAALFFIVAALAAPEPRAEDMNCVAPGNWLRPADGASLDHDRLIAEMANRPVVLLGESHDDAEHHRWQAQTIAALHGVNPNMVIALEMFPRSVQPALDAWSRGEIDEKRFLEQSRWGEVWRFDSTIYMPIFHFARMHRLPMVAMNVEHGLVSRVRQEGWSNIPPADREGLGDPLPASDPYRDSLFEVYRHHRDTEEAEFDRNSQDFDRFTQAQTTWDRAMAEKIAELRRGGGEPLVVGIVGRGHLEYGHGIPYQLADLGIDKAAWLLPWSPDLECGRLKGADGTAIADAVFGLALSDRTMDERPLLGVMIETVEGGVRVDRVVEGSIAAESGIQKDDLVLKAAGIAVASPGELSAIIQRQAPGTWLPLDIRRDGLDVEIIARFPPKAP